MSAAIGVVIVEDEERARTTLRRLLESDPEVRVLAETAGARAPDVIRRTAPDVVLLDVQMPDLDGFGVLRAIADRPLPVVVFVTAYDRYALDAFEAAAVDYLLKPFPDDRFRTAMARVKEQVRLRKLGDAGDVVHRLEQLLALTTRADRHDRLTFRDGSGVVFVDPDELDWVEADGVYVRLHLGRRRVLIRESLAEMERRLEPLGFVRIHRSALVNARRVSEIRPRSHGDYIVRLRDGSELTLSRTRKAALEALLGSSG